MRSDVIYRLDLIIAKIDRHDTASGLKVAVGDGVQRGGCLSLWVFFMNMSSIGIVLTRTTVVYGISIVQVGKQT